MCLKYDWVIDLDIKAFFDSIDHDLILKAVSRFIYERWMLLYVVRWLKASNECEDGTTIGRDRGTAQGSARFATLANVSAL